MSASSLCPPRRLPNCAMSSLTSRVLLLGPLLISMRCRHAGTPPSRSRPDLVGRELARPEPPSHLSDLVAPLLAQRVGGKQMVIAPIVEHLEHFDGGLLEQTHGLEVLLMGGLQ